MRVKSLKTRADFHHLSTTEPSNMMGNTDRWLNVTTEKHRIMQHVYSTGPDMYNKGDYFIMYSMLYLCNSYVHVNTCIVLCKKNP